MVSSSEPQNEVIVSATGQAFKIGGKRVKDMVNGTVYDELAVATVFTKVAVYSNVTSLKVDVSHHHSFHVTKTSDDKTVRDARNCGIFSLLVLVGLICLDEKLNPPNCEPLHVEEHKAIVAKLKRHEPLLRVIMESDKLSEQSQVVFKPTNEQVKREIFINPKG